jgi:galactokinase
MAPSRASNSFGGLFGHTATATAQAPGRVNLIGEHTDYNGGLVLPMSIPLHTRVELHPRPDRLVRAVSAQLDPGVVSQFKLGEERRASSWLDFVQGLTHELARAGQSLSGFEARVESDIPIGAGLASSAALEIALLRALRATFRLPLDDLELARLAQRAETDFVGARVGIMDQFAASLGTVGEAILLDTRSLDFERVRLPDLVEIVVVDSGTSHRHAGGAYNRRRAECEQASELLGVAQLGELSMSDLPLIAGLPEPLDRRARHVVTENARVVSLVEAFQRGDLARAGALFTASHESQRVDFEVSTPAIDLLVRAALDQPGTFGARLTGGGFGGSVAILAQHGAGRAIGAQVVSSGQGQLGLAPRLLLPRTSQSESAGGAHKTPDPPS